MKRILEISSCGECPYMYRTFRRSKYDSPCPNIVNCKKNNSSALFETYELITSIAIFKTELKDAEFFIPGCPLPEAKEET